MARWVWPTATGVTTSLIGIVVNLATEWKQNPWAWAVLVVLTGLGVVATMKVQEAPAPAELPPPQAPPPPPPSREPRRAEVQNSISGNVGGDVLQAGNITGKVDIHSVRQTAIARENSTIYQAGRDISSDDDGRSRKNFGKNPGPPPG